MYRNPIKGEKNKQSWASEEKERKPKDGYSQGEKKEKSYYISKRHFNLTAPRPNYSIFFILFNFLKFSNYSTIFFFNFLSFYKLQQFISLQNLQNQTILIILKLFLNHPKIIKNKKQMSAQLKGKTWYYTTLVIDTYQNIQIFIFL